MIGDQDDEDTEGIRAAPDDQFGDMTRESLAAYTALIGPHTIGVLVVQFDPESRSGWSANAMARPWLTARMFAKLMREAADRWDPPVPIKFTPETPPAAPDPAPVEDTGHTETG